MDRLSVVFDSHIIESMLYSAILVMLVSVLLLFFVLVSNGFYIEYRERRIRELRNKYFNIIFERLHGVDAKLIVHKRLMYIKAMESVLLALMDKSSVEEEKVFKDFIRESGIADFYKGLIKSRSWIKRFIAIEKLGLFKLPEMRPVFHSIIVKEKDVYILARAVWALSLVAEEADIAYINEILDGPSFMSAKYAEYVYTNIIYSYRAENCENKFLEYVGSLNSDRNISPYLKKAIIEACGSANLKITKTIMIDLFKQKDASREMRITCMRALGKLKTRGLTEVFRSAFHDEDWRVRAVAAKSASTGDAAVIKDLAKLLCDDNYHVRINAAGSLLSMGEKGISTLIKETCNNDQFARDVSTYVLKEVNENVENVGRLSS